jgi:muramoyltetrapeptide carboxypeptidase
MEQYGLKVVLGKSINAQNGYLAGSDAQRAEDINEMFRRPEIRGIVTFSGGYGCCRLLPFLDYEQIKRSPKVIVGHSDITSILSPCINLNHPYLQQKVETKTTFSYNINRTKL